MRTTQLYITLGFGLPLLLVTQMSPVREYVDSGRTRILVTLDTLQSHPQSVVSLVNSTFLAEHANQKNILELEKRNRELSAAIVSCQSTLMQASVSAMIRNPSNASEEKIRSSTVSFAAGQWIVLAGANDHVQNGDIVLLGSAFVGVIRDVRGTYSFFEPILTSREPLLVMHQQSQSTAILHGQGNSPTIQFQKKIDNVHIGDVIVSVPDGVHSRIAHPVATVTSIDTQIAQSITSAQVQAIAIPRIGDVVSLVLSQE